MTEGALTDRVDKAVDVILKRGDATAALRDPELAPLARVAAYLRHYPSPEFRARLRASLERRTIMSAFRPAEFHVYVEDVDAAFERALAAGAASFGEPADRPYGERAGFVRDAFGNHWFIATQLGGSYVPEGLRTLTPFLHVEAAAQYIGFLKRACGAVEEGRHDAPGGGVMYARLRIGDAAIELGEATGSIASMPGGFYVSVDDPDALYQQALAAGATSLSPPTDQGDGDRVAAVEDSTGNQWFIARNGS